MIAFFYSSHLALGALGVAAGILAAILLVRAGGLRVGLVYALLGAAWWVALYESGVDPVVVGLAMGLLTYAYPASRGDLERATDLFRLFREQPTPELARAAGAGVASAISPNERLAQLYHPWTSYAIVPLFALANAGIAVSGGFLARAYTSPVTLGILVGYVAGKPVGDRGRLLARHAAERGTAAAAGRLGGGLRRRHGRRDRLHRLAPDRRPRLPRAPGWRRRSSASSPRRSPPRS